MSEFVKSLHCTLQLHCHKCRDLEGGRSWRKDLMQAFELPNDSVDFICPFGKPWNESAKEKIEIMSQEAIKIKEQKKPQQGKKPCGGCSRTKRKR